MKNTFIEQLKYIVEFPDFKEYIHPEVQKQFIEILNEEKKEITVDFAMDFFLLLSHHYEAEDLYDIASSRDEVYYGNGNESMEEYLNFFKSFLEENIESNEEELTAVEQMLNDSKNNMVNGDLFVKYFYPLYLSTLSEDNVETFEEIGLCELAYEDSNSNKVNWCACDTCNEALFGEIYLQDWRQKMLNIK